MVGSRALVCAVLLFVSVLSVWATGLHEEPATEADAASEPLTSTPEAPLFTPQLVDPEGFFLAPTSGFAGNIDLVDFLARIEADRRLLSELRKGVPNTREEAEIFLRRLKSLADRSDPVRLAIRADRVLEQAPIYFNWLETEFESAEEATFEYYLGGAQGFQRAIEEFENAVLLTAINRLDTASRIVQEAYASDEDE